MSAYVSEASKARRQSQERLVIDVSRNDSPVKITIVKTKKRVVEKNKKFEDDDYWLDGLTLRLTNRSDRTVTYVGLQLLFRRTEDQQPGLPAGFPLDYGFDPLRLKPEEPIPSPQVAPLLPGGEIEINLTENRYSDLNTFLAQVDFPFSRKRLELDLTVVGFSDETMWNLGHIFRRDPTYLKKPLPGWRPPDYLLDHKWESDKPNGSAQNRTAFFVQENSRFRRFAKLWSERHRSA